MARRVYEIENKEPETIKLPQTVRVRNPKGRVVWMPAETYLRWSQADARYEWLDDPKFKDVKDIFDAELAEKDAEIEALKAQLALAATTPTATPDALEAAVEQPPAIETSEVMAQETEMVVADEVSDFFSSMSSTKEDDEEQKPKRGRKSKK